MKTLLHLSHRALLHKSAACFLVFCMLFVLPAQVTFASPSNPQVIRGAAGVTQSGNTTQVDVLSKRAVINWDSLNTKQAETLQFLHDGGHFAVLNRVMKGGATQFNGSLFGNQGSIVIVNPNGVVFGPTALVKAYSFTASSLDIDNTDFMNGVYQYAGDGVGAVANYGEISAEHVALIGKKVLNAGTISSPGGYTIMASGDSVYLGTEGSDVVVEAAGVTVPEGAASDGIGDVINEGTIDAADGKIIMAAGDTYARAIEGLDTLSVAVGSGVGRVGQFGTVTADGTDRDGGQITLTAADMVVLGDSSVTTANAGTNGDGGQIIAYSPDTALLSENATVEAKGGSESGNGGFVEVSGRDYVAIGGLVDTTAAAGHVGTFLIDPSNIAISSSANPNYTNLSWDGFEYSQSGTLTQSHLGVNVLQNQLALSDVIVNTAPGGSDSTAGWIEVRDAVSWSADTALTLTSNGYITIQSDAPVTNTSGSGQFNAYSLGETHTGNINVNANVTAGSITMQAGDPTIDTGIQSNLNIADGATVTAAQGDVDLSAREHINIYGNVIAAQGNVHVLADSDAQGRGNVTVDGMIDAELGSVDIIGRDVTVNTVHASDNIDITALEDLGYEGGGNATTNGLVSTDGGDITINAVEDITVNGPMNTVDGGNISMYSTGPVNSDIFIKGAVTAESGSISLNANDDIRIGNTGSNGGILITDGGDAEIIAGNDIEITETSSGITLDSGELTLQSGLDRRYDNSIDVQQDITAGTIKMAAGDPMLLTRAKGEIKVAEGVTITSTAANEAGPSIDMSAREHILIDGDVIAEQGNIKITADTDALGRGYVQSTGLINADDGSVDITGRAVIVNTIDASEDITLTGLQMIDEAFEEAGYVDVQGQLNAGGDVDLMVKASDTQYKPEWREDIYPESENIDPAGVIYVGDDITANGNVTLHNQTEFYADGDQVVLAEEGTITAVSSLAKTESGSLYLLAGEHVSLSDDVTNPVGGVSIIAENGRIFTPGGADDTLNVAIVGTSNDALGIGADLPDGDGKAAIILRSSQDLNIGADASLTANGAYSNDAEDRAGIGFLDEDANIGDNDRDQGIPSDIAIYAGSQSGNVNIQTANIAVNNEGDGPATVVFDAYDTVTMPAIGAIQQARINQENDNLFRFRLEVASRVTEWLFQAIDGAKLPYAADSDGEIEEVLGHEYVLRGAGLDNVNITDGRAWVLEDPTDEPSPVPPLAAVYIPEVKGCPVEMDAAASELAMNTDQLQLLIGNSMAYNPNLQPCEACQKLVTSANILSDVDGRRLAAMNEIFNTLAPADAPFTPEIQANITTAFANLSDEDPQYALAQEYVNAFADYVAVIGTELQVPVGDPVTFALEKHGEGITTNENSNVAAYIMAQAAGANL